MAKQAPKPEGGDHIDGRREAIATYLATEPAQLPYILTPIAALREIVAVCETIVNGAGPPQSQDRRSLRADAELALRKVGPAVRWEAEPTLSRFLTVELAHLEDRLGEGAGALRLAASARGAVAALISPRLLRPAFEDLVQAHDRGADADEVGHLALVLRELDGSLGHVWRWRRERYLKLLEPGDEGDWELLEERPATHDAQVAWFVFAEADFPDAYLRLGQIQFFSSRLWPEAVLDPAFFAGRDEAEQPEELDAKTIDAWFHLEDSATSHVYARVELTGKRAEPDRTPAAQGRPAEDWASELVSAVVESGTFRQGGSNWHLLEGVSLFHGMVGEGDERDGNWSGSGSFADPRRSEAIKKFRPPLQEGSGEALKALDPRFAELLASGDRLARDAADEVRWHEAARKQPDPAQRVLLMVRAFERLLPVSGDFRWNDALSHYLRSFWALDQFEDELFFLAYRTDQTLRQAQVKRPDALESWLEHEANGFTVSIGAFLRQAEAIRDLVPRAARIDRRRLRDAARWQRDPREARKRIELWEQRASTLLARALRQRNATAHGTPTVPEVVRTVDRPIGRIAAVVVAQTINAVTDRRSLLDVLEEGRQRTERILWRLKEENASLASVLYEPEDL